jgi:hypothetical protein
MDAPRITCKTHGEGPGVLTRDRKIYCRECWEAGWKEADQGGLNWPQVQPISMSTKVVKPEEPPEPLFSAGDLIKGVEPPSPGYLDLVGEVGFVVEVVQATITNNGDYFWYEIRTLRTSGEVKGIGTVPARCLTREDTPDTRRRKEAHDARRDRDQKRHDDYQLWWQQQVKEVSDMYFVSQDIVRAIHQELQKRIEEHDYY